MVRRSSLTLPLNALERIEQVQAPVLVGLDGRLIDSPVGVRAYPGAAQVQRSAEFERRKPARLAASGEAV